MEILVFGGTAEGRELVEWLSSLDACDVVSCAATEYGGELVDGLPRVVSLVGPLDAEAKERLVAEHDFACIVDATHPYATHVTQSISEVASAHGIPRLRLVRDDGGAGPCTLVADVEEAAETVASRAGNVLLTTGAKDLPTFVGAMPDFAERLYVRILPVLSSVEAAHELGIPAGHIIAMQGPFSAEMNEALIRQLDIRTMATKASGTAGGFQEKVDAAAACGVELVVIARPDEQGGLSFAEVQAELLRMIAEGGEGGGEAVERVDDASGVQASGSGALAREAAARLVIGAPASGGGKTTFTCGLLQAFANRGLALQACKCGPDYIDPMFHREVIGADSRNLDLFFMGADQVRQLVATGAQNADVTVVEGVMGYYDGIAVSDEASAWDVARTLEAPAILVVDGRGRARSVAAEVLGFLRMREPSRIAGVVVNRCSPMLYPRLAELIEQECGVRAYGYVPVLKDCSLESRHLGLVTASEVADLKEKLNKIASVLEETLDMEGLIELARSAPAIEYEPEDLHPVVSGDGRDAPVIAVARDDAFCFYYSDTLRTMERLGAKVVYFSPLADAHLPEGTCGLYLGGGYPELHCEELSGNASMLADIRDAIASGLPTIAECGGFMFLHEELEDDEGRFWPMAGVIEGRSFRTPKLSRFGYITITAKEDSLLASAGDDLTAHEFHYWDSDSPGEAFSARKPQSTRGWECAHASATLYAGYPHLCLHARPQALARFVRACAQVRK